MRLMPAARRLSVIGALFCAAPVSAASLVQVYQDALANDAQYASARANVEAGRERLPQGLAGLLPNIGASANTAWNQNRYDPSNLPPFSKAYESNSWTVSLTQPVFRWQNFIVYGQARYQVMQAEAIFAQASQELIVRVAQAYFDVLYAQEVLNAVRANKQAISLQLEQANKNFEVGTATITDSHEAQARFDLASAQEIAAQNDLDFRRYALRVIVGRDIDTLDRLRAEAVLSPPQPLNLQRWVAAAEESSPLVQAQAAAAEVAVREVERRRAGHYPTVDAFANYGNSHAPASIATSDTIDTRSANVGLQLNIPIFSGGLVSSQTREAEANRRAAHAALETARRSAALSAQQSFLGVVNGLAQVGALNAALVSSQSALESNKLGYEVGVRINIDVLNAEQQVFVTKRDLARARFDTLLAQLRLKAAAGILGEDDLLQVSRLFEAP